MAMREPQPRNTRDHEFTESRFGNAGVTFVWWKWRKLDDINPIFQGDRFPLYNEEIHSMFWESDLPLGPMMVEQQMGVNFFGPRLKVVISPGDGRYALFSIQGLQRSSPNAALHEFGTPSTALLPAPLDTDPNGFRKDPYGD